jgi:hypothetical protein
MPKPKKELPKRDVGVRMPAELHGQLAAYAKGRDLPIALVVRMAVREYLNIRANNGQDR